MAHGALREATVVGMPHDKWLERPVAFIVARGAAKPSEEELRQHLRNAGFAKWWLPDRLIYLDEIPKTGVGKFNKRLLREQLDTLLK